MKPLQRCLLFAILLGSFVSSATALTNQVVFFNGFLADTSPGTGLGILNTTLSGLGIPGYQGKLFEWTQRQQAFDWVQQFASDRSTLVLVGHSFGGNSTFQLANDFLKPAGITVDLTIQIDPVKNFDPGANNVLPTNVDVGFNYYQISTGFFEPQGEDFVQGATNFNTEVLFNDTSVTHTSIDNDPRLHALIGQNILDNLNEPSADFDQDGDVDGADFLVWQRNPSVGNLADWQTQYGGAPVLSVVPEPSSVILLLGFLWPALWRRSRQQGRHSFIVGRTPNDPPPTARTD
ncbi:alpha/beta hydrolase [Bythopirellula polymerisocia]|uniref:PEP-CTERM protein-sorting domain-containing protein n=1 Tax=Bythopirellula polymerisocia TaxID=2528003 RepID=A0A5C6D4U3_9BACT|nr:alpha/beta hydrolase [Bythopirellula polymerisocia]TWU30226.1 hypothetical protein Pla144_10120 [Bythopirellula polymerisocia]